VTEKNLPELETVHSGIIAVGSNGVKQLTLWRDWFVVFAAAEQSGAVENLMEDDGEAVDVSFLSSSRQSVDRGPL